jgi:N-acetylneuraminate synthase
MKDIILGSRHVGEAHAPFVIAEMSGNHNQSLERALEIVEAAASSGAHALKLQTYTADTMTLDVRDGDFYISDRDSLWAGHSLYELYQKAYTPWEWHKPLFERCRALGMIGFSTPFDASAVDFLETLDVPCYKVASFENIDLPLIRKVASTRKPMIISAGMATIAELSEAVATARDAGCEDLILLKCTSSYPASPADSNLATIPHMRQLFRCHVGLSDHTLGVGAAVASVAFGAVAIEKHVTLRRADGGVDSDFSLEPAELRQLVDECERAWQAVGTVSYGIQERERGSIVFRRSLYVAQDMRAGEVFTAHNLRVVRPGMGLAPKFHEVILGKRAAKDLPKGTALTWDLVN